MTEKSAVATNVALAASLRARGLRRVDVAAAVGVSGKTVKSWLAGRVPYVHNQNLVAALVGVPVVELWPAPCRPEVTALYPTRESVPAGLVRDMMAQARERIDVLAHTAGYLWEGPDGIVALLASQALAGARVRVLLADPDGSVAGRDSAAGSVLLAERCRIAVSHVRPLLAVPGVEVRLHDEALHAEVIRGDSELLVTHYVTGRVAQRCPVLHLNAQPGSPVARAYLDSIDHVAMRTRPLDHVPAARHRPVSHLRRVPVGG